ncbi:MAG: hypothetical protein PHP54_01910 [Clostridia bacterium]|nr:hypothetical protein [Clostridia bacterium]
MPEIKNANEAKLETESARSTYRLTHPEEYETDVEKEIEVTVYYQCLNPKCGFVAERKHSIPESKVKELVGSLAKGTCPECGHTGFKLIDEKDYKKLKETFELKKKKQLEEKEPDRRMVKITLDKIKKDIKKIQYDLENMLKEGKIDSKRYVALMYNLIFSEYKYYRKDENFDFSMTDFNRLAKDVSGTIAEKYYVKESLDGVLSNYSAEEDLLYLNYTKMIAEESLLSKDGRELEETTREINELQNKMDVQEGLIREAETERQSQERYNDKRNKIEDKFATKSTRDSESKFLKELSDSTKKS